MLIIHLVNLTVDVAKLPFVFIWCPPSCFVQERFNDQAMRSTKWVSEKQNQQIHSLWPVHVGHDWPHQALLSFRMPTALIESCR
ncbi:MAG: hypothetical protein HRT83_04250 [Hyphomicrobiaceae bacterium]|nr:hypothetical protein [Hyphomicrobiaceae bacterium]